MASRTWFITGASRGFGRAWAAAALARGDRVAATARDVDTLAPLCEEYGEAFHPLTLDVTDRSAAFVAVEAAHERFGGLDIVVNNAGYGVRGAIEEMTEELARAQLETNLFGALWVTQAALPRLRAQGSGHIVQVSSVGGLVSFPSVGLYHASKWGLEGFSEALAAEVAPFGIRVTLIEPGGFDTGVTERAVWAPPLEAYGSLRAQGAALPRGKVAATVEAIFKVVDAEPPPLRVFFGEPLLSLVRDRYAQRLALWEEWQNVAAAAQGR